MATAVWTGTLSFGLITLPVRLYPATQAKDVRFHLYDREGRRIRYQRVVEAEPGSSSERDEPPAPETARDDDAPREDRAGSSGSVETPVAWEDVVRGVETDEGELVTVPKEELERIRPGRSRSIDIEDFVEMEQIDPVSFDKSYYAIPMTPEATRPYVLFHHAMREAGRIGIGRFVLRTKPHLVAIGWQVLWVLLLVRSDRWRRWWRSKRCSSATRSEIRPSSLPPWTGSRSTSASWTSRSR